MVCKGMCLASLLYRRIGLIRSDLQQLPVTHVDNTDHPSTNNDTPQGDDAPRAGLPKVCAVYIRTRCSRCLSVTLVISVNGYEGCSHRVRCKMRWRHIHDLIAIAVTSHKQSVES